MIPLAHTHVALTGECSDTTYYTHMVLTASGGECSDTTQTHVVSTAKERALIALVALCKYSDTTM